MNIYRMVETKWIFSRWARMFGGIMIVFVGLLNDLELYAATMITAGLFIALLAVESGRYER